MAFAVALSGRERKLKLIDSRAVRTRHRERLLEGRAGSIVSGRVAGAAGADDRLLTLCPVAPYALDVQPKPSLEHAVVINIQFDEAADLLWELLKAVPEERRAQFSQRVNRVASCLQHPSDLDGTVVVSMSSDHTIKGAIALRGVVLPLKGLEVA